MLLQMQVNHRCFKFAVAKQRFYYMNVTAIIQHVCGKAVTQGVRVYILFVQSLLFS